MNEKTATAKPARVEQPVRPKAIQAPQVVVPMPPRKRACLGGNDLAKLLRGEMAISHGVEFVYDGSDVSLVKDAITELTQAARHDKR